VSRARRTLVARQRRCTFAALPRLALPALLLALALACSQSREGGASARPEFNGDRAFRDLAALVQLGPRPAGSQGAELARALIRDRLRQAGWVVEAHEFTVARPHGPAVAMANLIARRSASGPARTLVITHYDTKDIPGIAYVGANDGSSGVAVLLELARVLAADDPAPPVALVFFDGEESFGANIDQSDGLYGSKALAQRMADDGSLAQVGAVVLVDMVGDRDLNLARDLGSSAALRQRFEAASAQLHLPPPFDPDQEMDVIDDHTPFQQKGVREVLVLLDFQYGARVSPGPRWHTAGDTLDAVSADSLARVGRPLAVMLRGLGASAQASP